MDSELKDASASVCQATDYLLKATTHPDAIYVQLRAKFYILYLDTDTPLPVYKFIKDPALMLLPKLLQHWLLHPLRFRRQTILILNCFSRLQSGY
ncbi:hypothetical protein SUGI_0711220 [Cryptomeria japonica]|nr:hypothetical protein SUGI_0711220 [Cryptomeria japonica]